MLYLHPKKEDSRYAKGLSPAYLSLKVKSVVVPYALTPLRPYIRIFE